MERSITQFCSCFSPEACASSWTAELVQANENARESKGWSRQTPPVCVSSQCNGHSCRREIPLVKVEIGMTCLVTTFINPLLSASRSSRASSRPSPHSATCKSFPSRWSPHPLFRFIRSFCDKLIYAYTDSEQFMASKNGRSSPLAASASSLPSLDHPLATRCPRRLGQRVRDTRSSLATALD